MENVDREAWYNSLLSKSQDKFSVKSQVLLLQWSPDKCYAVAHLYPWHFQSNTLGQVRQIPVTSHDIDPEMGDDGNELDEVEKEVVDQKTVEW